jgi:exopolysaccharide production protein ExoZ
MRFVGLFSSWLRRTFELQDRQHARLLPMEGLRGLAVTLVFLQHFSVQAQLIGLSSGLTSTVAAALRNYGNSGVDLFFVLSGYLIYGTLVRRPPSFLGFMLRRVQRIYPTFLVVFVLALVLAIFAPPPGKIPSEFWHAALYLAANLALLPGLIPMNSAIVAVAWSLSYEMFFYVMTAALVLGLELNRTAPKWRITILAVLAGAFILLGFANIPYFPLRMMPFFAGMLLAEGVGSRISSWLGWAAPVAAFVATVMHVAPGAGGEMVLTLGFFMLCAVCFREAGTGSGWMTWTPLRWIGNISYSYYLMHGFVVRLIMVGLAHVLPTGMPDWLFWLSMAIIYLATLVCSAMLFVAVEKPISLRPQASPVRGVVSV